MYPVSRLSDHLQQKIIKYLKFSDLPKLLQVNRKLRDLVQLNGPFPKRIPFVRVYDASLLDCHGHLLYRDIFIKFDFTELGMFPFDEQEDETFTIGPLSNDLSAFVEIDAKMSKITYSLPNNHFKWPFLERIGGCKEMVFDVEPKQPLSEENSDQSYAFDELLPNFIDVGFLRIYIDSLPSLRGFSKYLPFECQQLEIHEGNTSQSSKDGFLWEILRKCHKHPKSLRLNLESVPSMRDFNSIWDFQEIAIRLKTMKDFNEFFCVIWKAEMPPESKFASLQLSASLEVGLARREYHRLFKEIEENIGEIEGFEPITEYSEAIRGFTNEELGIEMQQSFQFEVATRQIFGRKPVSFSRELVGFFRSRAYSYNVVELRLILKYRKPQKSRSSPNRFKYID